MTPTDFAALPSTISTRLERRRFFRWLLANGINFHPDTPAADYVRVDSGERIFDDAQAARLDRLMDEAVDLDGFVYDEGAWLLRRQLMPEVRLVD